MNTENAQAKAKAQAQVNQEDVSFNESLNGENWQSSLVGNVSKEVLMRDVNEVYDVAIKEHDDEHGQVATYVCVFISNKEGKRGMFSFGRASSDDLLNMSQTVVDELTRVRLRQQMEHLGQVFGLDESDIKNTLAEVFDNPEDAKQADDRGILGASQSPNNET